MLLASEETLAKHAYECGGKVVPTESKMMLICKRCKLELEPMRGGIVKDCKPMLGTRHSSETIMPLTTNDGKSFETCISKFDNGQQFKGRPLTMRRLDQLFTDSERAQAQEPTHIHCRSKIMPVIKAKDADESRRSRTGLRTLGGLTGRRG